MASWDDGNTGFSLGTNLWSGLKGADGESLNQRTGIVSFRSGDFGFNYENDGGLIIKDLRLGDRGDSYRTAALNISVGDFGFNLNLFTGRRSLEDQMEENIIVGENWYDSNGVFHKNSAVNEKGQKYRLGASTLSYKNFNFGVNSEKIRHAFQNWGVHRLIGDGEFETTSWGWSPYFIYKTQNIYTSW